MACFFLSILLGILGGVGLTTIMVFLFVKSYGKIIGYMTDNQVYIKMSENEQARLQNMQGMEIFKEEEYFSLFEKQVIEEL
jgi:hypothetical protein